MGKICKAWGNSSCGKNVSKTRCFQWRRSSNWSV